MFGDIIVPVCANRKMSLQYIQWIIISLIHPMHSVIVEVIFWGSFNYTCSQEFEDKYLYRCQIDEFRLVFTAFLLNNKTFHLPPPYWLNVVEIVFTMFVHVALELSMQWAGKNQTWGHEMGQSTVKAVIFAIKCILYQVLWNKL